MNFASARPGAIQTRDGKRHHGELSFTNGAVQVSNDVEVASIPRAEISHLSFQPETVAAAPESKGEGLGLLGYYFANTNVLGPVQVRLDPVIDFDWGITEPIAGIGKDYFAIIWMGYLEAPASGEFTFQLAADENARLQIGPDFVVEASRREQQEEGSGALELEQGKRYPVTLLYRDLIGAAKVRLAWSGPNVAKSPIPADRLYPKAGKFPSTRSRGLFASRCRARWPIVSPPAGQGSCLSMAILWKALLWAWKAIALRSNRSCSACALMTRPNAPWR